MLWAFLSHLAGTPLCWMMTSLKRLAVPPLPSESQAIIIYKHDDISSQDLSQLNQPEGDTSKKPTTDTIPLEELLTLTNFGPAAKWETFIIESLQFLSIFKNQTTKALFDPKIRESWGELEHPVCFVYFEASFWLAIYAAWNLKKEDKTSEIHFQVHSRCQSLCTSFFFKINLFVHKITY